MEWDPAEVSDADIENAPDEYVTNYEDLPNSTLISIVSSGDPTTDGKLKFIYSPTSIYISSN